MDRVKLNAWVDILLLITFVILGSTGLMKYFGYNLGLPWRTLSWYHDSTGLVLVVLSMLHIYLHWNWWKNLPKILKGK